MNETLDVAFERVAATCPDAIAIAQGARRVTYAALADRVRACAARLRGQVGERTEVVFIIAGHGEAAITGLLCALRAGYVAAVAGPDDPAALLQARIAHAGANALLADSLSLGPARRIAPAGALVVALPDAARTDTGESAPAANRRRPEDPALIIYTSGSTAEPRGVTHSHAGVLRNATVHAGVLGITAADRAMLMAALGTVSGITDTFRILLSGATLWPVDLRVTRLAALPGILERSGATIVHLVPTVFRRLVRDARSDAAFCSVRLLHLGGEPVTRRDFNLFCRHMPDGCRLLDNLGCSEVPTFRQSLLGKDARWAGDLVPLRDAVPDRRVVLVGADGADLADGAPGTGEVAVEFTHAALGYWRDPPGTAAAFTRAAGTAMRFRTGDIARREPDGSLVHLGRSDRSVKVLGRWMDLAGLEAALLGLPAVDEAAVVPVATEGGMQAWAFCTCAAATDAGDIRRALGDHLEASGSPVRIVVCESLPHLAGGKIDYRALQARTCAAAHAPPAARAAPGPGGDTEGCLQRCWARVLPGSHPDRHSNFVEDGGDSLAALELLALAEAELGLALDIPPALVFETADLGELADALDSHARTEPGNEYLYRGPGSRGTDPILCIGDHTPLARIHARFGAGVPVAHLRLDGLQTPRFRRLSVDAQAAAYAAELRAAGITRPIGIVGFSYGGLVAWALAAALAATMHPVRPPPVLLLEPTVPGHPTPDLHPNARRRWLRGALDVALGAIWRRPVDWDRFRWGIWRNVRRYRGEPLDSHVVLAGTASYLERWAGTWAARARGGFESRTVPGHDDHFAVVAPEHAEIWLEVIDGWLERRARAA